MKKTTIRIVRVEDGESTQTVDMVVAIDADTVIREAQRIFGGHLVSPITGLENDRDRGGKTAYGEGQGEKP